MTNALWITSAYPWPGDTVTGVFFGTQARALARLGLEITVAAPTPWAPWPLARLRPKWRQYAAEPYRGSDHGVDVVRPRYLAVPGQPSWSKPDRYIEGAAWRAQGTWRGARLIHGHYAVTGLAAWRLAVHAKLPFVLTFHGDDMNVWPQDHPERLHDLRAAVREASGVVTVSQALADLVAELTGVQAAHIPLGIDHAAIAAAALPRPEARRRLGIPDDRIVVLMVGYLLRYKGVRVMADAVLHLGDPFLGMFVGSGPEQGYGLERPEAARLLDYRGQQPHDRVGLYLSAADVVVLPSTREGQPTILIEAGSLGIPVIASAVGGIPDLLGDGRGTLLPEISSEALVASLAQVTSNRERATASGRALCEHVHDQFDVDKNARRLLDLYRSIAPGLGDPGR